MIYFTPKFVMLNLDKDALFPLHKQHLMGSAGWNLSVYPIAGGLR